MYGSRKGVEKEIFEAEMKLKKLKKSYRKIIKSFKGKMNDEMKEAVKCAKESIKLTEKEIRNARIELYRILSLCNTE